MTIPQSYRKISFVIPVYNEEQLIEKQVHALIKKLKTLKILYEILIIENGSEDKTYEKARGLARQYKNVRIVQLQDPQYGEAIKKGLVIAKNNLVVQFDIDFIDFLFLRQALTRIGTHDVVVGSKLLSASRDKRPLLRLLATRILSLCIRYVLGYRGTDTHGIKVYKRNKVLPLLPLIGSRHHFFDSELLLHMQKSGYRILELPVSVSELRPTRFSMPLRLPLAVYELLQLIVNERLRQAKHRFSGG